MFALKKKNCQMSSFSDDLLLTFIKLIAITRPSNTSDFTNVTANGEGTKQIDKLCG